MAHTTEVFFLEPSDAYQDNPKLIFPAYDIALKAPGSHPPLYYGKQIENSKTPYVFLDWDNYEAHEAAIKSPPYSTIVETITACTSDMHSVQMYHVKFSAPASIVLEQPVVGVLIVTLKAPEDRATVVQILTKISERNEKFIFGATREDENKYFVISGWQSVEEHLTATAKPESAAALDKLYSLVNKDHFCHINLSQYRL